MKRDRFSTTLQADLLQKLKILAVLQKKPANELIEEALVLLFAKYGQD